MAKARIPIPTVNEKLLQRYVRHAVYLEQLKNGEAKLISRFLKQKVFPSIYKKLIDELSKVKNLETLGSIRKIPAARLKRMLAATQKISIAGMVKAEKMLVNRLVDISKFEADWNADIISKTVPFDLDMSMPSNEVLRNLVTMRPMTGHKLGTWMRGYSTAVRVAMTKQIKVGIATGESLPAIGRRINKALNWKGKQAQYIARTAVSNVVHQAKEEVFKKNTDIVRKVQWVATLDDKTSLVCINYDGQMFNVGYGPRPPAHFNCRSTVVPITPSWQEFGIKDPPPATRASMNGAVPAKTTYKQWLKKQPKAVQVKVLGKKRAELYRSGQVKIDRFVGKNMKPLNLKQLARREGLDLAPAPPTAIKAIPTKGTGQALKDFEISAIRDYRSFGYDDIRKLQLGTFKPDNPQLYQTVNRKLKDIESGIVKLPGYKGETYRGLEFATESSRVKFLTQFKKGEVWKSKTFQSTSKDLNIAELFAGAGQKYKAKSVIMRINGVSGREISQFAEGVGGSIEKEILFKAGTSFKVDKIVGNKVYLTEITKQAQLKAAPSATVTKARTTFTGETTKEFKDLVNKQLDIYPEKVRTALNKNGVSYNFGERTTQILPHLKGKHPRGWSKGTTWDSVEALYNIDKKEIFLGETYKPVGQRLFAKASDRRLRSGLNHETGHAFNHSVTIEYSESQFFKKAYKADIKDLTKSNIADNRLGYFLQKGKLGRDETFSEVFAQLIGEGSTKRDIGEFFPNCKEYIEDLLK